MMFTGKVFSSCFRWYNTIKLLLVPARMPAFPGQCFRFLDGSGRMGRKQSVASAAEKHFWLSRRVFSAFLRMGADTGVGNSRLRPLDGSIFGSLDQYFLFSPGWERTKVPETIDCVRWMAVFLALSASTFCLVSNGSGRRCRKQSVASAGGQLRKIAEQKQENCRAAEVQPQGKPQDSRRAATGKLHGSRRAAAEQKPDTCTIIEKKRI